MKIDVIFVWVVQIDLISVCGIEFGLISACRDGIDLVVVWVIELTWFLNTGPKSLVFSESMQNDWNFVWVAQINFISAWGIEVDLIAV